MRILIVTQYFWPESFRINDLALGLLGRGHQVTVLTGIPNYPGGELFDGYGFFNKREDYCGVRILRVPLIPRGTGGSFRLILNYLSFAVMATVLGPLLCREAYDRIFVFEPSPITVGIPAVFLKKLKKAPMLFWVQDLWPESLIATGAVRSKAIVSMVGHIVEFIYRHCDLILVQAKAFCGPVAQQGGSEEKIRYFPNAAENLYDFPVFSSELPPLPEGFRILFAGNIGAAQDFETIIAAAENVKDHSDIKWIIIGDGRMRAWSEAEVQRRNLRNVYFLGKYPPEAMPAFFAHADALLVTLKKEPVFALTVPSKIQSYLACGKPIIAALEGEASRIITESGSGFCCPAGDADALAEAVLKMYATPEAERKKIGDNGRAYHKKNFDRDLLLDKLEQWLKEI